MDDATSNANAEYWNELCGTNIAKELRIDDMSPESISKFDVWFFDFYPYLIPFLENSLNTSQKVLEVGLGYGSVATYLCRSGYHYTGLDIALGPVEMCRQRMASLENKGIAFQGDALKAPFESDTFDAVIAIGSLHHTGDFDQAMAEMVRITKDGGVIGGMVYSIFSARNFILQPLSTFRSLSVNLKRPVRVKAGEKLRWLSDHNQIGESAPATEYFSRRALRSILSQFGEVELTTQNLDALHKGKIGSQFRKILLNTKLADWFGLDIYFKLRVSKPS